jgi:AraC-like DNA-binding protein
LKRWTGGRTFAVDLSTRSFADDWRGPMLRSAMLQAAEALSAIPDGSVRVARFLNADEALLRSVALCFSESFFAYCQSPPRQASSKQVRRADDFIAAHASKPLRVADIAEAAGVSERSLQLSFKRELGCSPMDRVRERRLSLAFDAMRVASAGTTVTSIAATFGFRNAGDFSVLFRQRFGHLPSEILKRVPMSTPDADL